MTAKNTVTDWMRRWSERQRTAVLGLAIVYIIDWVWVFTRVFYRMPTADAVFHFLGGLFVGLFFVDFFWKALAVERGLRRDAAIIVGLTLLVGLAWEVHEYLLDLAVGGFFKARDLDCCIGDLADTLSDLLLDALGAVAAVVWVERKHFARRRGFWSLLSR